MYHFLNGPKKNKSKSKTRKLAKGMKIYLSRNGKTLGFILDVRVPGILLCFKVLRTTAIECLLLDL